MSANINVRSNKPQHMSKVGDTLALGVNMANITSGVEITEVKFGLLYNWYAATDVKNIVADGWHIPTEGDFAIFYSYILGTEQEKSLKVCEPNLLYWDVIEDATNELNFNGRGSGVRDYSTGEFTALRGTLNLWTATSINVDNANCYYISLGLQFNLGWNDKNDGKSLRPIKDVTTLSHGETGTYTGNDGKIYRTICIGTQEWVADNLAETRYRLSTQSVKYGMLYNWYAATDVREICSDGCHIPTEAEFLTLIDYLDPLGEGIAGGKLKEMGFIYWNDPNVGATNEVGYNGRAAGYREDGIFMHGVNFSEREDFFCWTRDQDDETYAIGASLGYDADADAWTGALWTKDTGLSIRPVKDATTLSHGETGTYTGNDGKGYRTICIGTQEWLADNLAETKYRNGDSIPEVTDAGDWVALDSGARCSYDNDEANAMLSDPEGDLIPEVTDNDEWAALTTGALCAYNNNWDNV